jgi:hypothetical protein
MGRRDDVTSHILTVTSRFERPGTVGARAHHDAMTDDQAKDDEVRVFDRLIAAGLSIERIEQPLTAGRVRVDGQVVTDPYTPAPPPAVVRASAPVQSRWSARRVPFG